MISRSLTALVLCLWSAVALAQTNPGFQIGPLNADVLNQAFSRKADYPLILSGANATALIGITPNAVLFNQNNFLVGDSRFRFANGGLSLNFTSSGCEKDPATRAVLYICNNNNGTSAAGFALGWEVWIGNNPVGSIAANNAVATFVYVDNTNGRQATWASNYVCNQLAVGQGGSVVQNHCQENDVLQSQVTTTPLSAFNNQGPVTHAYEAVCSQNTSGSPQPCHVAFWVWAAGDYANSGASQTQPFDFAFAAARVQTAGFGCELQSGDTGTYFKQGCVWDQSNSAASHLVSGTHTSIIDSSGATYTQFANCNATCGFTGKLSSSGGIVTTGNAGAIGLASSIVANATSGNSGFELQQAGVTRGYLAATSTLMQLKTNGTQTLNLGTNNTDAIVISGTQVIQMPAMSTGTPASSACFDASNNLIKKTTAGSCI